MNNSPSTDEDLVRKISPEISKTLTSEFPNLPQEASVFIQQQTLLVCLRIHRKAHKQHLNLFQFVRHVSREQALVWLTVSGTPSQQKTAMNLILERNRGAVARYLGQYHFRTSDVIDDVLNESFEVFFKLRQDHKPLLSLIVTSIINIARNKALHHLRNERTKQLAWLKPTFITVDEEDIGSFEWSLDASDEDTILTFKIPSTDSNKSLSVQVEYDQLQQWIADCFTQLSPKRQLLIRLRYKFLTNQELESFTIEEIQAVFGDTPMTDIAKMTDYPNAHTASVRLNESLIMLRKCLTQKLMRRST